MLEKKNDFWIESMDADAIVVTTNNVITTKGLVMGAGIALQFKEKYPDLPIIFGQTIKNEEYNIAITNKNGKYIIAVQTKFHFKDASPMELVVNSCRKLYSLCDTLNLQKIVMVKPGCGNGNLLWPDVKNNISFLDDRFVVVSP